ncbi:btb poz domain-containing protein [Diaporthe amygdali]|uniref:btb poz domain-containing protein n=1 Tax=Phomopsis amygdali TaxID=1214568 RepID=UPI0022FF0557|nr:btb poz domain-containing protein [Diaporthe amygdali]KAJ0119025.1 btb poz domain-containing protein [Diaporthe amygdali]
MCTRRFLSVQYSANDNIIKLFEADAKALDAVIHFLYHLDYPSDPSLLAPEDDNQAADRINGANGENNHDDSPVSVKTEEPASSLDDFLPISVSKSAAKQRKKRARRKSMTRGPSDPPGTITEVIVLPDDHGGGDREEGASLVQAPVIVNGSGHANTPPRSPTTDSKEGGIVLHAKVYGLSKQLGIDSLQALALLKFETDVEEQWSSDEFIDGARELASILTKSDNDDGKIREVILDTLCKHVELLNKEGIEIVIRSMDLGYDIVKQLNKRGLIASAG